VTLLELCLVLALMSALVAGTWVLRQPPQRPVSAGRDLVLSLVEATRAEALRNGEEVALWINADTTAAGGWREFRITQRRHESVGWRLGATATYLPDGVYLVPPAGIPSDSLEWIAGWPAAARSVLPASEGEDPEGFFRVAAFDAAGHWLGHASLRVVLSAAERSSSHLRFGRPELTRTLTFSRYGVATNEE
jgi:hypothetical protein